MATSAWSWRSRRNFSNRTRLPLAPRAPLLEESARCHPLDGSGRTLGRRLAGGCRTGEGFMSRPSFRMGLRVVVATLLAVSGALVAMPLTPANAVSPNIVISQVYGAGGNTGATYQRDYIELFNRGASAQVVTGWSVQYTSSSGAGLFSGAVTNLTGSIPAGGYYLVAESQGTSC